MTLNATDIGDRLEEVRKKYGLPALAAARCTQDSYSVQVRGVRKIGYRTPVQTPDKFHLGSCTKAMTATVLAIFIERRALRWDSTLAQIFPEWVDQMHPAFRGVTVELLTSHRAGIRDCSPSAFPRDPGVEPRAAILILGFLQSLLDKIEEMFPGIKEMKER